MHGRRGRQRVSQQAGQAGGARRKRRHGGGREGRCQVTLTGVDATIGIHATTQCWSRAHVTGDVGHVRSQLPPHGLQRGGLGHVGVALRGPGRAVVVMVLVMVVVIVIVRVIVMVIVRVIMMLMVIVMMMVIVMVMSR
jgi:hypothetical protein